MGTTIAAALATNTDETTLKGVATRWFILMLVWGFSSVLPDLVMGYTFFTDKIAGRRPLEYQPGWLLVAKEITHNLLIWGPIVFLSWYCNHSLLLFFGLSGLLHTIIDVLTHGKKDSPHNKNDCKYTAPIYDLKKLNLAIWEYRIEIGSLKPKPFELGVCIVLCAATIALSAKVFLPFI